ncbi:hypothetical protein F5884DRAFT_253858 [Xylogone sp. PMI_703]|nr:hypothetical protein F5884DRAFT_253858 [Xylogone sp. PMI_703]
MTGMMLPLLNLLIFSISCCYAANFSSHAAVLDLPLPRGDPASFDGFSDNRPRIFGRASSQDPSCPDGFMCVQQACPDHIICPEGESCFNFEGTVACGDPGLQFCALNPSTFEAVACNGGTCCHGNCYKAGTVCCDFDSIQCNVGELCNACSPGQTCGNNQCNGGGSSSPPTTTTTTSRLPPPPPPPSTTTSKTTTATTTTSNPPPPPPPTTTTTTTSTTTASNQPPSSSTTKASSSSSSNPPPPPTSTTTTSELPPPPPPPSSTTSKSTTSAIPTPTLVPSVGSFSNTGCFLDSTTARVLIVDSLVDQSANGMTVEKCVAFATAGAFQFAGVEFGG